MLIINFLVTGAFSPFARSGAMSHMLFREWFYFRPIMTPKKNWNYCFRSFQFFFFQGHFSTALSSYVPSISIWTSMPDCRFISTPVIGWGKCSSRAQSC